MREISDETPLGRLGKRSLLVAKDKFDTISRKIKALESKWANWHASLYLA